MSFGEKQHRQDNASYVANLLSQDHESVLEHANFTILADGISRALTHQLVRHRAGFAYSQLSQQYHDESDAEFLETYLSLKTILFLQRRWQALMDATRALYKDLAHTTASEAARSLPDARIAAFSPERCSTGPSQCDPFPHWL